MIRSLRLVSSGRLTQGPTRRSFSSLRKPCTQIGASRTVSRQDKRIMTTAAPSNTDSIVEEPKGWLGRGYETYPLLGLGLVAAITQEWVPIDESFVLALETSFVFYSLYLFGADRLAESTAKWKNELTTQMKAAFGIRLDNLKRLHALESFGLSHGKDLSLYHQEEIATSKMLVEYQNTQHKIKTKAAVLTKLNMIKALEDESRRVAVIALATKAREHAANSFIAAPANVKNARVEQGINQMVPNWDLNKIVASRENFQVRDDDPLKILFDEFLAQRHSLQALGVQSNVEHFMGKIRKPSAH